MRIVRTGFRLDSALLARLLIAAGGSGPRPGWHLTAGLTRELQRYFRTRDRPAARRGTLPRLHRHPAQQGRLPERTLLCRAQWAEADHRVVLERLSGDGA